MVAISRRLPSVAVEYTKFGKRVTKKFKSPFEARRFYYQKFKEGKEPKVIVPPVSGTPQ